MTQFYSRVTYSQGGSNIFTIPFDYINDRHIKVYIDDTELEEGNSGYVFLNSTQIQIKIDIPTGSEITIKRETPIDEKIVTYRDTSMVLNDKNLNLSQDQLLNAVQEIYDDNEVFKETEHSARESYEQALTTQQETFETTLINRQTNYENNLTNNFNKFKQEVRPHVYEQAQASDTWVIEHNLNRVPAITLIDQFGREFRAEKEYPEGEETTKIIIHLNGATTGKVLLT